MYAEDTKRVVVYLNGRRSSVDRQVLAHMRGDLVRGKAASAVIRQALAQYYGIERPALPSGGAEVLHDLTAQVAALAEAVAGLQAQIAALQEQNRQQAAELHRVQLALIGLAFGDRGMQQQARAVASATLAALSSNGNGNGNGGVP